MGGNFSWIFTVRTWWCSWRENSWKSGVPLTLDLEEFLTIKLVHTQTPVIYHNPRRSFPISLWLQELCSGQAALGYDSLYSHAVQIPGWWFALRPPFSDRSKTHWLSFCSDFYLLLGGEWQLPSSLHVGTKWFVFQIPIVKFYHFHWHSLMC